MIVLNATSAIAADPERPLEKEAATSFWTPRTRLTGGLLLGSVALAGAGFAFGRLSVSNKSDAEGIIQNELPPGNSACHNPAPAVVDPCGRLRDARDSQNTYYALSLGTWVAAGVVLTSAVATYLIWPKSPATHVALVPYVSVPDRSAGFTYSF